MSLLFFPLADCGGSILSGGDAVVPHNKFVIFSLRSRKRKQEEEEEEFDDEDIGKNEEDEYDLSDEEAEEEDLQSDADSSDDEDGFIGDKGDNRVKPSSRNRYFWYKVTDLSPFQSIDEDKIFRTSWSGHKFLCWDAERAVIRGERALESKQKKRTIKLERVFGRSSRLTQVPYRELTTFIFIYFIIDCQTFLTCC